MHARQPMSPVRAESDIFEWAGIGFTISVVTGTPERTR
jgi:hypothetical protein